MQTLANSAIRLMFITVAVLHRIKYISLANRFLVAVAILASIEVLFPEFLLF